MWLLSLAADVFLLAFCPGNEEFHGPAEAVREGGDDHESNPASRGHACVGLEKRFCGRVESSEKRDARWEGEGEEDAVQDYVHVAVVFDLFSAPHRCRKLVFI